jgi:hypothetical protein
MLGTLGPEYNDMGGVILDRSYRLIATAFITTVMSLQTWIGFTVHNFTLLNMERNLTGMENNKSKRPNSY